MQWRFCWTENFIFRLMIGQQIRPRGRCGGRLTLICKDSGFVLRKMASASLSALERELRAWTRSHLQGEDIDQVAALATRAREEFSVLVTIGVGGSDLSARVFHDSLNHPYHNLLSPEERGGAPEVYFSGDTFDPRKLMGLLEMLKARNLLQKTLFNVISKSGTTTQTMATLMVIRDALGDVHWQQQVLAYYRL